MLGLRSSRAGMAAAKCDVVRICPGPAVYMEVRDWVPVASEGLLSTSRKMSSFLPSFSHGPGMYCASCGTTQLP